MTKVDVYIASNSNEFVEEMARVRNGDTELVYGLDCGFKLVRVRMSQEDYDEHTRNNSTKTDA